MGHTFRVAAAALCVAGFGTVAWAADRDLTPATASQPAARVLGPCFRGDADAEPCPPGGQPNVGGCSVFPADNAWNRDISSAPVHPNSANFVSRINGLGATTVHPDFGSNPSYGIPFVVVPQGQARVPITYTAYGDESDPGPFPIPANAPIEGGGDRHVLVVEQGVCQLFELFVARPDGSGGWLADSGATWSLFSNASRPDGWTSADAAGLPILPGLAKFDEVAAGQIDHALRFTVTRTQRAYVPPATHFASSSTNPNDPPMGLRFRLKATYDISRFSGQARVVAVALQRYGMIVADNGSNWFISGATDPRWNDTELNQLKSLPGNAFEVVVS